VAPCGPLGRGLQILFLEPGSEASRFSHILISKLVILGSRSSLGLLGVPGPVWAAWVAWGCLGLSWDSPGALLGPLPGQALWLPAVLWGSLGPGSLLGTGSLLGLGPGFLLGPGSLLGTGSLLGIPAATGWADPRLLVGLVVGGPLAVGRVGWLGPLVD
jgi:hypothetical protein